MMRGSFEILIKLVITSSNRLEISKSLEHSGTVLERLPYSLNYSLSNVDCK